MQRFRNYTLQNALSEIGTYSKREAFLLARELGQQTDGQTKDVLIALCQRHVSQNWESRNAPQKPDELNRALIAVVEILAKSLDENALKVVSREANDAAHRETSFETLVAEVLHHHLWLHAIDHTPTIVHGDHPILARVDRSCESLALAVACRKELEAVGYKTWIESVK